MHNTDNQDALRAQVSTLGDKFLARTRGEVALMRELIERLGRGESQVLQDLRDLAHKIHGSGAVFGFVTLSEIASEIEHLCEELSTNGPIGGPIVATDVEPSASQRLSGCVERLARAIDLAAAHPPLNPNDNLQR